ncbi:MAG: hypothetical protein SVP26_05735 [Chloroflexota bacterium]|nr:hypothetical protein [Chloroflexota bacterium]
MKWWLRSCPRCAGDLYEDIYGDGDDCVCLQCGMVLSRQAVAEAVAEPVSHGDTRVVGIPAAVESADQRLS